MKSEEASDVDVVMLPFIHFAVDFMEAGNKILKKGDDPVIKDGLQQSVHFLVEIMKAFREKPDQRSLPEGFLVRLWTVARTSDSTALLKTIFEVSDCAEFEEICSSIIEQLVSLSCHTSKVPYLLISILSYCFLFRFRMILGLFLLAH